MKYFPLFRTRTYEMIAVRELASEMVGTGRIVPIFEPISNSNSFRKSLQQCVEENLRFLFIVNPKIVNPRVNQNFAPNPRLLVKEVIRPTLQEYENWVAAYYVDEKTTLKQMRGFLAFFIDREKALIYTGQPKNEVLEEIGHASGWFAHHVFLKDKVEPTYIETTPIDERVYLADSFNRQDRNADYEEGPELFTAFNTLSANPDNINFGDYSIESQRYRIGGSQPNVVAAHYIHLNARSLYVSHFLSNRRNSSSDTKGKTLEALRHLVNALGELKPNDTDACREYREMVASGEVCGLGPLKGLSIQHHLEIMLRDGVLEGED